MSSPPWHLSKSSHAPPPHSTHCPMCRKDCFFLPFFVWKSKTEIVVSMVTVFFQWVTALGVVAPLKPWGWWPCWWSLTVWAQNLSYHKFVLSVFNHPISWHIWDHSVWRCKKREITKIKKIHSSSIKNACSRRFFRGVAAYGCTKELPI
jgi:hypothetical protein